MTVTDNCTTVTDKIICYEEGRPSARLWQQAGIMMTSDAPMTDSYIKVFYKDI